jgi:hypothetical protein
MVAPFWATIQFDFNTDYFLNFFTNHFNNNDTLKLTTAPSTARTTVLIISDEPMFTNTVKTVPETVPMIVPLSMLLCVDIIGY